MKSEPSTSGIADGLSKLYREVKLLREEVAKLTDSLRGFKKDHPLPEHRPPHNFGYSFRVRPNTDEPESEIQAKLFEYRHTDNLEIPTRTLFAIAKALDGALLDVRAARSDISAITDDSDLRADFKNWQDEQNS